MASVALGTVSVTLGISCVAVGGALRLDHTVAMMPASQKGGKMSFFVAVKKQRTTTKHNENSFTNSFAKINET